MFQGGRVRRSRQLYNTRHHDYLNMPLLCGPEVHTNINDKGIPRESPIPGNVTYVCMCVCMVCVCMYVCVYACTFMYVCMYVYMYVCMYVCMYIMYFIYIYIYIIYIYIYICIYIYIYIYNYIRALGPNDGIKSKGWH